MNNIPDQYFRKLHESRDDDAFVDLRRRVSAWLWQQQLKFRGSPFKTRPSDMSVKEELSFDPKGMHVCDLSTVKEQGLQKTLLSLSADVVTPNSI